MAHCGRKTRQFIGNGFGMGGTKAAAIDVATAMADIAAMAKAADWIAQQECKDDCPFRSESTIPWGKPRVRVAVEVAPAVYIAVVSHTFQANVWCKKTFEEEGAGEGGD